MPMAGLVSAETSANAVLEVPVTAFRDARDVVPRARLLAYPELVRWLAPERPPVRADVGADVARQHDILARVLDDALNGRVHTSRAGERWFRDLERVDWQASANTEDADVIAEALRARAHELGDALRRNAKTVLPCWSPVVYRRGRVRGADGVEDVTCLVLDHDDGTSIDEATAPWMDWPHIVHTSWSHTDARPRFRVVLVLSEPVPAARWPAAWAWAAERAGGHADPACKDPSRLYFLPALPSATARWEWRVHDPGGLLLRIDAAFAPAEAPAIGRVAPRPIRTACADRRVLHLLRADRATRERAATFLEAQVVDRRADRITCPGCGRPTVWFWLEPGAQSTASCKHRGSCGWWGHLDELLDLRGGVHGA
jgi:hypothetical protein